MSLSCWMVVMGPVHTSQMNSSYITTKKIKGICIYLQQRFRKNCLEQLYWDCVSTEFINHPSNTYVSPLGFIQRAGGRWG